MTGPPDFTRLAAFLQRVPAIQPRFFGSGEMSDGIWYVKFAIDIKHELAWRVVQELGHVLNFLSTTQQLPTVFKPVSPPAYLNGGPEEFLSWVIESTDKTFTPDTVAEWLDGRLPNPVDDLEQWKLEDDDEDEDDEEEDDDR